MAQKPKGLVEKQIAAILDRQQRKNASNLAESVSEFVVRQKGEIWTVEFTYRRLTGRATKDLTFIDYKVILQRGGVRVFSRLKGVQSWMQKMGVPEFKVVLCVD
jgi:hypothetical protein